MKYSFIDSDSQKPRTINIPEEYIARTMRSLNCSQKEACELYLSDEGYVIDETVRELTEKAKSAGCGSAGRQSSVKKRKAPVRKPNYEKRWLIAYIVDMLQAAADQEDVPVYFAGDEKIELPRPSDIEITNQERMIAFSLGEDDYEIMLTKKRKPKKF